MFDKDRSPVAVPFVLTLVAGWVLLGWTMAWAGSAGADGLRHPEEVRFGAVRQLTAGGENAEAYWSPDGDSLVFQATRAGHACDQIFRLPLTRDGDGPPLASGEPQLVSTGQGRTTCAYFTADGERILFSSTHEASADCPVPPDRSQGYVWPLHPGYEIYSTLPDGSDLRRLTDNEVYDAEATVCPTDGSVIFTSTRDGDLDLYRMGPDGSEVSRLTHTPGYDGGAFFSPDCSRIVWRASRPSSDEELVDFRELLARDLVRPGRLEIWVANADGSDARQITYLDAASFAPYFTPSGERVIFSSNYGDPRGREFDLWAVDVDGTDLERITFTPEFDGFPMFSPDGRWLAFASNRNRTEPGETNVFVTRWNDGAAGSRYPTPADDFQADVAWLAADERQGRGVGTEGLAESARWLAERFAQLGLEPGVTGEEGPSFLQAFEVPVAVELGAETSLALDGEAVADEAFRPAAYSASTGGEAVTAEVVPLEWGITAPELSWDDYEGRDVEGKIALVRRFVPPDEAFEDADAERRYSDLRYKAWNAREHGAVALLVVDQPSSSAEASEEAPLPGLSLDTGGDAGLPVVFLRRSRGAALFDGGHRASLTVELLHPKQPSHNVVARIPAGASPTRSGAVLLGAHYDHLGFGGRGSLTPDQQEPHNGADDNASGTAALLQAARLLMEHRAELPRDVWLVAFSAEESGLLGSTHFTRHPPVGLATEDLVAMINMDMVGRLRDNQLQVLGTDSAQEWAGVVEPVCREARVRCEMGGDGYGPSDQTPFYAAGVPVVQLFTGTHDDYHKPSDDIGTINAVGGARVGWIAAHLAAAVATRSEPLTLQEAPPPPPRGDVRSYGASLGTIPDYAGPEDDRAGVLLAGVRAGSAAEAAGFQRGDLLVELAGHAVGDIYDFMFVLRRSKPGETVSAMVERDGERVELTVTFDRSRGLR